MKILGFPVNALAGIVVKSHLNSNVWMQIFSMQAEKEGVPLPQGPRVANVN